MGIGQLRPAAACMRDKYVLDTRTAQHTFYISAYVSLQIVCYVKCRQALNEYQAT
jgi:hypothetical protein